MGEVEEQIRGEDKWEEGWMERHNRLIVILCRNFKNRDVYLKVQRYI